MNPAVDQPKASARDRATREACDGHRSAVAGKARSAGKAAVEALREQYEARCRALTAARQKAEAANQAKSRFLADLSHEIRTPMNAILGYAQLLQRAVDLPPQHRAAVETIERSGAHLLSLINDVLDLSKIEAGRMELQLAPFDLNALVYDLAAMFNVRCEQKKLRWLAEIWHPPGVLLERAATGAPAVPNAPRDDQRQMAALRIMVQGDERKLRQVVINLLSNAVKFTAQGEVILRVTLPSRQTTSPANADAYLFEVIDNGPGIPPGMQAQLFQPFAQDPAGMAAGGTGLGLVIAKRHLELMGSELQFESKPGRGSRFHFTVRLPPASPADPDRVAREQACHLAAGTHVQVLVVDDVAENRDVLSRVLADLGCEVATADSGEQALASVRAHHPAIVFMDIRMPAMDGLETTRRILAESGPGQVRVVALSASVLTHERDEYLASGFDDFIAKPFRIESVCECMARLLGVRFEYEPLTAPPRGPVVAQDFQSVRLPDELRRRLRTAAQLYQTTALKRCVKEMGKLGGVALPLAGTLLEMVRNYDMESILRLLEETEPPPVAR